MLITQVLATAFIFIGICLMIGATILYAHIVISWEDFNSRDRRDVNRLTLITLISVIFIAIIYAATEYFKHLIS